jgi:hypothetical protein
MDPICLLVAGVVRASLPGPEFSLSWEHSVEKTRWEERYRVDGDSLLLVEARIAGSGAGMESPPEAILRDGVWTWKPGTRLPELRVTLSEYTRDYTLCARDGCNGLATRVGPAPDGSVVVIRRCA